MTLRKKTLLIIGLVLIGLVGMLYAVSQTVFLDSFSKLEKQDTSQNVERALGALSDDISELALIVSDWALWDYTYNFVEDLNESYVLSNLNDESIANLGLNTVLFVNSSGQIVYGKAFDLHNQKETPVPQSLQEYISASDLVTSHFVMESSVSGIILLPEGPMLIASYQIMTSEHKGPIRGALIMGRYLDSAEVEGLAEKTRLALSVHRLDDTQMPADFEAARSALAENGAIFVRPLDSKSVAGYTLLKDINGAPVLVLRADMPRGIYQEGQASLLYFILLLVGASLLFVVMVGFLLERFVLSPLSRLNASVRDIGAREDLSAQVAVRGRDEVSSLGGEINRMLKALQRSREAQRESEMVATATIEGMADGVMLVNMEGKVTYVNKAFEKLLGHKAEEIVGTSALELPTYRNSKDRERATEALKMIVEKGSAKSVDMTAITKDGEDIPISFNASVIKDAQGKPQTLVAVLRDVTERRWAEEALRRSEEYFRTLMENSLDAVTIMNEDGTICYESPSYERLLGFKPEEKVGSNLFERIHPDDITRVAELFAELLQNRGGIIHTEVRARHKDGSWRVMEAVGSNLLDNPVVKGIVVNLRDITERKKAEEALIESEAKLKLYLDNSPDAIYINDAKANLLYGNRVAESLVGYSKEELTGKSFLELGLLSPEYLLKAARLLELNFAGKSTGPDEFELIRKDGSRVFVEISTYPVGEGDNLEVIGIARDTTERKKAEESLKESEARYRRLVDNAQDIVFRFSVDKGLEYVSPAVTAITGYTPEELMADPKLGLGLATAKDEKLAKDYQEVVSEGKSIRTRDITAIRKDGKQVYLDLRSQAVRDKDGNVVAFEGILRDVTESRKAEEAKRKMEEQLRLAGRLAAVGELSAGVAHELNNPIAAIQGFAQLLASRNDLDEVTKKDLGIVYREAQRAAKITQNLLSFARRHEPEKHLISLNEVIETTLEMRAHQMKVNNIELVVELAPDLPKTLADFFQMQQVFVNIINNAEQEMVEAHGRGRLVVKTQKEGNMIQAMFADNGPGISEENMKRIFDPFFTTKEVGKGTGLGLSICYGIVEAHGGRIYARSKLGEGATFVVEIPIISEGQ